MPSPGRHQILPCTLSFFDLAANLFFISWGTHFQEEFRWHAAAPWIDNRLLVLRPLLNTRDKHGVVERHLSDLSAQGWRIATESAMLLRDHRASLNHLNTYSLALPEAFAFLHLALASADNLALAAALICLFGFDVALAGANPFSLRSFAHLALAAAAILARPAALICRFPGAAVVVD